MNATLDGAPAAMWSPLQVHAGNTCARPRHRCRVRAPISRCRRLRRARLPRQQVHLHAGPVRRPRRARAARRRRAAPGQVTSTGSASHVSSAAAALRCDPHTQTPLGHRRAVGPHGAPDFFTPTTSTMFFATDWEVHYNSSRTGVRLIGPKPRVGAQRRRRGRPAPVQHPRQRLRHRRDRLHRRHAGDPRARRPEPRRLRLPGHRRRSRAVEDRPAQAGRHACASCRLSLDAGQCRSERRRSAIHAPDCAAQPMTHARYCSNEQPDRRDPARAYEPSRVRRWSTAAPATSTCWSSTARWSSISTLRFRVHALMAQVQACATAPARHHRPDAGHPLAAGALRPAAICRWPQLLEHCCEAPRRSCRRIDDIEVPTRIVHLPLSWDDPATRLAIEKYMQSVRTDAPWCPSNIEFIRRINGLDRIDDGAATSSSTPATWCWAWATSTSARRWPRRSIRATAWSPPSTTRRAPGRRRTRSASAAPTCASTAWKARAATSSSAAPADVEPLPRRRADFTAGKPWLLRFFDQIRFYPVEAEELLQMREDFSHGRFQLAHRRRRASACATTALPGRQRRLHRRLQAAPAGRLRGRARALGGRPGSLQRRPGSRRRQTMRPLDAAGQALPARSSPRRSRAASGTVPVQPGAAGRGRRRAGDRRVDEDGDHHAARRATADGARSCSVPRGRPSPPGRRWCC